MPDTPAALYDAASLAGAYSSARIVSDFIFGHAPFGLVFSIDFSITVTEFEPVEIDLTVTVGDRVHTGTVPGRFQPPNTSLVGRPIPNRLFLALPLEWKISEAEMQKISRTEIHTIRRAQGPSLFDDFCVAY